MACLNSERNLLPDLLYVWSLHFYIGKCIHHRFCLNLGLEQSSGEWIMFVDGDDVLVKNALNILYHQIQFYKYDLTRFGMYLFKNSKKIHSYEASFSCDREEYQE